MKRALLLLAVLAGLCTSCSFYKPQAADIPLINHSGDLRVDGCVSMSTLTIFPTSTGAHLTGSYGINDWMAAQAHLALDGSEGGLGYMAIGAYYPYKKFVVEGYLGAGLGYTPPYNSGSNESNVEDPTVETSSISYTRNDVRGGNYQTYFLQANVGWVDLAKGHIDIGFGIKQGWINSDFRTEHRTYHATTDTYTTDIVRYRGMTPITEPQLMFRAGSQNLKFSLKLGFLIMPNAEFVYSNFTISAGINYRL
ncbi:MAG: hypothetical protein J5882_03495 [Bacteroidales bacterium]|nr:hypothetical protein [Bacteroidales bacterium]